MSAKISRGDVWPEVPCPVCFEKGDKDGHPCRTDDSSIHEERRLTCAKKAPGYDKLCDETLAEQYKWLRLRLSDDQKARKHVEHYGEVEYGASRNKPLKKKRSTYEARFNAVKAEVIRRRLHVHDGKD